MAGHIPLEAMILNTIFYAAVNHLKLDVLIFDKDMTQRYSWKSLDTSDISDG